MSAATATTRFAEADLKDDAKAERDRLFRAWLDAKRCAAESEDPADHAVVAQAYTAFMRAHLSREERDLLALEDEVARLTAENLRLGAAILQASTLVEEAV
ncbi:hypothetical protein [Methylobacterium nodulans]|uniref:Uncharacterized protein n=1 Tax=Methylobacterium nodulans (strain LMG 21967 / CNCM I-2342 / ORS 2060) TaxID=460265 RepID=B8IT81_METNO|nr:hypothetical protein [Methylobacterium nodulans]ACL56967.1 hypothetical protein Mnod_1979 [Methylobacterium nodulans ORS 2060]